MNLYNVVLAFGDGVSKFILVGADGYQVNNGTLYLFDVVPTDDPSGPRADQVAMFKAEYWVGIYQTSTSKQEGKQDGTED